MRTTTSRPFFRFSTFTLRPEGQRAVRRGQRARVAALARAVLDVSEYRGPAGLRLRLGMNGEQRTNDEHERDSAS